MESLDLRGIEMTDFGTLPLARSGVLHPVEPGAPAQYTVDHGLHVTLSNRGLDKVPLGGWQIYFHAPAIGRLMVFSLDPALALGPGQSQTVSLGASAGESRVPLPRNIAAQDFDPARIPPIYRRIWTVPGAVALFDPGRHSYVTVVFDGGGGQDLALLEATVETCQPGSHAARDPIHDYSFEALVTRRLGTAGPGRLGPESWAWDLPGAAAPFIYDPDRDPSPTRAGLDPDYLGPPVGVVPLLSGNRDGVPRPARPDEPEDMLTPMPERAPQRLPVRADYDGLVLHHPTLPLGLRYDAPEQGKALSATQVDDLLMHLGHLGAGHWPEQAGHRATSMASGALGSSVSLAAPFRWSWDGTQGRPQGIFALQAADGAQHNFALFETEADRMDARAPQNAATTGAEGMSASVGGAFPRRHLTAVPTQPSIVPSPQEQVRRVGDRETGELITVREYPSGSPPAIDAMPPRVQHQVLQAYRAAHQGGLAVTREMVLTLIPENVREPTWVPEHYSATACGFRTADGASYRIQFVPPADDAARSRP